MTDYDWPAIARATGWRYLVFEGFHRFIETEDSTDILRAPTVDEGDAHAALEATGVSVLLERCENAEGDMGWRVDIDVGRVYSGYGTEFCTAACRALEAYGRSLAKEEEDG